MYRCDQCAAVFTRPVEEFDWQENYNCEYCPECGSDELTAVKECPRCHGLMDADTADIICPECRLALRVLLEGFLDGLSDAQLEQIDIWMDGGSIHDRGRWK